MKHPNMPATGEQILCLSIREGALTVHNEGTVTDRERFSLTDDEFTTSHGSRYDCRRLHPMTDKLVGYLERFTRDPVFIYCREQDKAAALAALKRAYVAECTQAEETLQERARLLHEFAADASKI